ncbi:MAG: hypothetical protein JWQ25_594 [Daejeonella sp.]|nr:hypothetical protein [Daejeonella sp.]
MNGKKYLALDIPYSAAYHSWGFKFAGWSLSSSEVMKVVNYEINGLPVNQTMLTNIQDFVPNMTESHSVGQFNVSGSLAIGTTDARGYKLAVNGSIRAREIKVEAAPWPDFVFAKDFKKTSLFKLEKYIEENNHLPNIPSASEVAKDGINLGEMNAKLLQKIEELTLYVIEQNKTQLEQDKKFKQLISQMQNQIEELKNK